MAASTTKVKQNSGCPLEVRGTHRDSGGLKAEEVVLDVPASDKATLLGSHRRLAERGKPVIESERHKLIVGVAKIEWPEVSRRPANGLVLADVVTFRDENEVAVVELVGERGSGCESVVE
jgi:hypothetical protein